MDDTWIDSQIDSPVGGEKHDTDKAVVIEDYSSDSDATSDIIPQYDGPPDQKGNLTTLYREKCKTVIDYWHLGIVSLSIPSFLIFLKIFSLAVFIYGNLV